MSCLDKTSQYASFLIHLTNIVVLSLLRLDTAKSLESIHQQPLEFLY